MWLDVAIAVSCGGAGLMSGWVMRGIGGYGHDSEDADGQQRLRREKSGVPDTEQVTEVAHRLQSYALTMAADVDAHQSRMQQVNNSLNDGQDASHEDVVRAVSELIDANEEMQTQLKEAQDRIQEQTIQIECAERRAQTDALTRVPNRRALDQHMESRIKLGGGKAGTLALLDVDLFKQFNDLYGHRAGDEVLRVVANILHSRLQSYGVVARFGGEEFAIVLDGFSVANARSLVERARLAIGDRDVTFEDKRLRVSASIGVAEYQEGETMADWLQRADEALYRSKSSGRDCGHWMDGGTAIRIDIGRRSGGPASPDDQSDKCATDNRFGNDIEEASPVVATHGSETSLQTVLPDVNEVGALFDELVRRAGSRVSVTAMAIRFYEDRCDTSFQSLMQVVRSTLRGVDRLGLMDGSTLIIGMPSLDQEMAVQQARQICRGAEAVGLRWEEVGVRPFCIGIVSVQREEPFRVAVSRAARLADQGAESYSEPVWVEQLQSASSV